MAEKAEKRPETVTEETRPMSRKKLQRRLAEVTEEYRMIGPEANAGNSAALNRRSELSREMRSLSDQLHLGEEDVEVQVPRSTTGHPFRINDREFRPGRHNVKASVAQVLLEMIDKNRESELNRLRQNGETVDLGAIGDKASMSTGMEL